MHWRIYLSALLSMLTLLSHAASSSLWDANPQIAQAQRDMAVLASDAMQGRANGSRGSLLAQDYLSFRMAQLQLTPLTQNFTVPFSNQLNGVRRNGVNVVGLRRGCLWPDSYIVVSAHYDHLPMEGRQIFNGADDNASGVAAMLYVAELSAKQCPNYSQVFIATDAEEAGLYGAKAFLAQGLLPAKQIVANMNLDMISRGERRQKLYVLAKGQSVTFDTWLAARPQQGQVRLQRLHARQQLGAGLSAKQIDWSRASDHAAFHRFDIPYVYFGVGTHPHYHTTDDDFVRVSADFYRSALLLIGEGWQRLDAEVRQDAQAAPTVPTD